MFNKLPINHSHKIKCDANSCDFQFSNGSSLFYFMSGKNQADYKQGILMLPTWHASTRSLQSQKYELVPWWLAGRQYQ
jgi:hypothetical protein